jgi:hypothetical protein
MGRALQTQPLPEKLGLTRKPKIRIDRRQPDWGWERGPDCDSGSSRTFSKVGGLWTSAALIDKKFSVLSTMSSFLRLSFVSCGGGPEPPFECKDSLEQFKLTKQSSQIPSGTSERRRL